MTTRRVMTGLVFTWPANPNSGGDPGRGPGLGRLPATSPHPAAGGWCAGFFRPVEPAEPSTSRSLEGRVVGPGTPDERATLGEVLQPVGTDVSASRPQPAGDFPQHLGHGAPVRHLGTSALGGAVLLDAPLVFLL